MAQPDCEFVVAIDFGSESMAACFFGFNDLRPEKVNLQAQATTFGTANVEQLTERENGTWKTSERLRTRISVVPAALKDVIFAKQAGLLFDAKSYLSSAFRYFHSKGEVLSRFILPNPKILYQHAVRKILPEAMRIAPPEDLLKTTVVQIINNFVLTDETLRARARMTLERELRGSDVFIVLTIPNVYSSSHAEKIRKFVEENARVGGDKVSGVDTIYESDAIAHYLFFSHGHPPASLERMLRRIDEVAQEGGIANVLTIDIGRGTTDLSFASYDHDAQTRATSYKQKARTGRGQGGARLTYLFAALLNDRLENVYSKFENSSAPWVVAAVKTAPRLLFRRAESAAYQPQVLIAAEALIETVKCALNEKLRLDRVACQKAAQGMTHLVEQLVGAVRAAIEMAHGPLTVVEDPKPTGEAKKDAEAKNTTEQRNARITAANVELIRLRQELLAELTLPASFPRAKFPLGLFARLSTDWAKRTPALKKQPWLRTWLLRMKRRADLLTLCDRIDEYLTENVDETMTWLVSMVEAADASHSFHEVLKGSGERTVDTFVVVAGQASQFKPLQRRIRQVLAEYDIPVDDGVHLVFMEGVESKFACAFGASMFHRTGIRHLNRDAIHGTYGFLNEGRPRRLTPLDMKMFEANRPIEVDLPDGVHQFVYQARHIAGAEVYGDEVADLVRSPDAMAFLCPVRGGGRRNVTHLGGDSGIEISWTEANVTKKINTDTSGFGEAAVGVEHIYTTTWPELLREVQ